MNPDDVPLRQRLLRETLAFMYHNSLYYRDKHGEALTQLASEADFKKLEPLSKGELLDNLWKIRTTDDFPFLVGLSGGTTGERYKNKLAIYPRGREEVEFNRRLFRRQVDEVPRPLALKIINPHHGLLYHDYVPGAIMMPLENQYQFSQVKVLLQSKLQFKDTEERVSIIIGASNYIKLLFCLCARDALLPSLTVRQVFGTGDRLTPRWSQLIGEGLGASITEAYGVSEVVDSISTRCPSCGGNHFLPTVFPELLPIDSLPPNAGFGELALTSLIPTTLQLPLLRYRTGDIARALGHCEHANEEGYEILGRLHDSFTSIDPFVCIPSGVVEDIIDQYPEVGRRVFQAAEHFGLSEEIGLPLFRFELGQGGEVQLILKSSYPLPLLYRDELAQLCSKVKTRLGDEERTGRLKLSGIDLKVSFRSW